jgi:outer membrane protein assembly factor BamB
MKILKYITANKWKIIISVVLITIISSCFPSFWGFIVSPKASGQFPLTLFWEKNLGEPIINISAANEEGFIVRTSSYLYLIDINNGDTKWLFPIANQVSPGTAVYAENSIFIADGKFLRSIAWDTGQLLWEKELIEQSAWVTDVGKEILLVNLPSYEIQAYSAKTGDFLWRKPTSGRGSIPGYIDGEYVLIPDYGITALEAITGNLVWTWGTEFTAETIYYGGKFYEISVIDSTKIEVVALNPDQKEEVWRIPLVGGGPWRIMANGGILVVTTSDIVYVINRQNGVVNWSVEYSSPTNPTLMSNELFIKGSFNNTIKGYSVNDGYYLGSLKIGFPQLIYTYEQNVQSISDYLIFNYGNHLYAYK